jgi:hypothetical protein
LLAGCLLVGWAACTGPNPRFELQDAGLPVDATTTADAAMDALDANLTDDTAAPPDAATVADTPPDLAADTTVVADAALPLDLAPDAPVPVDLPPDAPPPVELVAGLLAYWRFDESDGARTMRDSSGRGNNGVFEGTSSGTGFIDGKFGRAFELTSPARDFGIRVGANADIRAVQRYTLAAWVLRRRNVPSEYCGIISRQIDGEDGEVFNMMVSRDYLKAYGPDRDSSTGRVTTASTPTPTPLNVWFHAAATFDGNRIRIYQDGVEQGFDTWTDPLPAASTPMYLATKKVMNWAHPFIGALDEVMLYDRALPPEAIAALARGERPPLP